jgi:hypothetical protein
MMDAEDAGFNLIDDPMAIRDDAHPSVSCHGRLHFANYGIDGFGMSNEREPEERDQHVVVIEPTLQMDADMAEVVTGEGFQRWLMEQVGPAVDGKDDMGAGRFVKCLDIVENYFEEQDVV